MLGSAVCFADTETEDLVKLGGVRSRPEKNTLQLERINVLYNETRDSNHVLRVVLLKLELGIIEVVSL